MVYSDGMVQIVESTVFTAWLASLKDPRTRARILARIDRLAAGNAGDIEPVGGGISELRLQFGPGYRIYVLQRGTRLVILLCGGDKRSQKGDIARAKTLASNWKD